MKNLWKTRKHYYIMRFAFVGMGCRGDEIYDTATQISISTSFHVPYSKNIWHQNIKREIIDEWKFLQGWRYIDENC